jgi:hypothetical protein
MQPRHAFTTEDAEDRGEKKEPAGKLHRPDRWVTDYRVSGLVQAV